MKRLPIHDKNTRFTYTVMAIKRIGVSERGKYRLSEFVMFLRTETVRIDYYCMLLLF